MPRRRSRLGTELSFSQVLADPIVHMLMASDGVSREELERLISTVCSNLAKQRSKVRPNSPTESATVTNGALSGTLCQ